MQEKKIKNIGGLPIWLVILFFLLYFCSLLFSSFFVRFAYSYCWYNYFYYYFYDVKLLLAFKGWMFWSWSRTSVFISTWHFFWIECCRMSIWFFSGLFFVASNKWLTKRRRDPLGSFVRQILSDLLQKAEKKGWYISCSRKSWLMGIVCASLQVLSSLLMIHIWHSVVFGL